MSKKSLTLVAFAAGVVLTAAAFLVGCGSDTKPIDPPSSSNSSTGTPSSSSSSVGIPPEEDLPLVIAINSGGAATTLDGVEFNADKYARGGSPNSAEGVVSGGELYQTERYGALSYDIPVTANGLYTVELHFAEIYHASAGARSFNVAIEGNPVISSLDLYSEVGNGNAYTETFADILVSDGSVTIELIEGVENPTIAGFAIYSRDGELDTTVVPEPDLDFSKFSAYTEIFNENTVITSSHATGHVGDFFFTHWKDGGSTSLTLDPTGEFSVTWQGGGYNYVGGPGWHYGDEDRVIGFRFDNDSGASYITLYGWGYDKDMPASDPAHLVEYYVLQRWTYDPSQGASYGTTFMSGGVEYSTYRSTRHQQPSINSPNTFYQYWSKPTQQRALGEDHEIIFADHVRAWAESGWVIPNMDNLDASDDPTYQVMAVEVFNPGNDGTASGRVWDATP